MLCNHKYYVAIFWETQNGAIFLTRECEFLNDISIKMFLSLSNFFKSIFQILCFQENLFDSFDFFIK